MVASLSASSHALAQRKRKGSEKKKGGAEAPPSLGGNVTQAQSEDRCLCPEDWQTTVQFKLAQTLQCRHAHGTRGPARPSSTDRGIAGHGPDADRARAMLAIFSCIAL
jgi:hypothetical protein